MNLFEFCSRTLWMIFLSEIVSAQQCEPFQSKCDNGDCIDWDKMCDGGTDCADGSDENFKACSSNICPKFTYRCAYGACISMKLKCNGVTDCNDGSDESIAECGGQSMNKNCPSGSYQCDSLDCINSDLVCDGSKDCADGSDESTKICASIRCPKYTFQCAYGACITKSLKCNGRFDCADASDEFDCNTTDIKVSTLPAIDCMIPIEGNLILRDTRTNTIFQRGTFGQAATSVKYECPKGYVMDGKYNTNFCSGISWVNAHPVCIKTCPPIKGITITAICSYKDGGASCTKNVLPGTTAKLSCAMMYEKPRNRFVYDQLTCLSDGDWDQSVYRCEQICGTVNTKVAFSIGGTITQVQRVPWHVAIYYKTENGLYTHICGGTLIESKLVVTAAHCFWDLQTSSMIDKSHYIIAAGKYYRDFYAKNDTEPVQMSNISKIDMPIGFEGADYNFAYDIAVLTLNDHIIFKNHIRPACVLWLDQGDKIIKANTLGLVAGWGLTDNDKFSTVLRSVELVTIDNEACKAKVNDKISRDKFCVENRLGKNVCPGDSGGGFLVPTDFQGTTHYILWGVVSNGITHLASDVLKCSAEHVTSFTNVQWYDHIVKDAKKNVETYQ